MKYFLLLLFPILVWGNLDHASIAVYAINCKSGEVVLDLNGDKSLMPSSCMKVVTTGAALHLLGPESHFQTDLEIDGVVNEGVLQGNVIIRGGGDPCLGAGAWQKQIEVWTAAIEKQGIKEIQGEIIGDDSKWEKIKAVPSWEWEDLGNYYGAGASALSFHENMSVVTFKPGQEEGACATLLRVMPAMSNLVMKNEVVTGPVGSGDRATIYGSEYSTVQVVRGTVPAGVEEFSIKGAIPDPAKLCSELLALSLLKKDVKVVGSSSSGQMKLVVHTTLSPKLSEIVYWTNQRSHNLYAEHLLKSMGKGTTESGTKAVIQFWKDQGIDTAGLNMADGSGLSRKNFITPQQLALMLVKMKQSPYFAQFYASLPEEKPGIRAKSGFMSSCRGLTGYKGDIAFAILINHGQDSKEMKEKLGQILDQL
jgi:serine-type D-Ala-D-Ala carboxypeptidase/endopeptidase (penicillin-binding protein 4)